LLSSTGSSTSIAIYVIGACVVGALIVAYAPRSSGDAGSGDAAPLKEGVSS
jgi:hypothetical protein